MEQLRRKMMKMVVMINVVSMVMMRTVRMTRLYVERASLVQEWEEDVLDILKND